MLQLRLIRDNQPYLGMCGYETYFRVGLRSKLGVLAGYQVLRIDSLVELR